jgi:hypothetical protein
MRYNDVNVSCFSWNPFENDFAFLAMAVASFAGAKGSDFAVRLVDDDAGLVSRCFLLLALLETGCFISHNGVE